MKKNCAGDVCEDIGSHFLLLLIMFIRSVITSQSSFVASFPHPALPLVLLKKFHRGKPDDKTEAPGNEDGDSDFEEIHESVNRFSFTFFVYQSVSSRLSPNDQSLHPAIRWFLGLNCQNSA